MLSICLKYIATYKCVIGGFWGDYIPFAPIIVWYNIITFKDCYLWWNKLWQLLNSLSKEFHELLLNEVAKQRYRDKATTYLHMYGLTRPFSFISQSKQSMLYQKFKIFIILRKFTKPLNFAPWSFLAFW